MYKQSILFFGSERSKTNNHELEAYANDKNNIYLRLKMPNFYESFICLDKQSAIKLVKVFKKRNI